MLDHPISEHPGARTTLAPFKQRVRSSFRFYGVGKRLIDLALVAVGGPFFLPLIMILVFLIRLDGGPAFYLQPRIGRDGRIFRLWKLRSMVPNAEAALAKYLDSNPEARAEWDSTQKLRHDPRLTLLGGFLRRYSLDELPQLWNVLIGDMSLVGPRPMMPSQRLLYPGTAYYDLRPGLTGLWQISERNNCTFAERAAYDNRYAQSVSAGVDFAVLVKTVSVVFRGTGC
ncbi:MAG: Undecaprenyl-phosphate galactosephosphotransferase [Devosia sp.]|jgi:exopolysaccharide production protein ExoY|uniref:sugar transferase n=1 Tax=Devosia sp. TaxID=1871048 RepID=UPI0026369FF4|nr:sugar transferase [Devosia sp.]MDB5527022.1 Undecaprenyl-phosphate galactosephosphotransferase [Devosia sp.]